MISVANLLAIELAAPGAWHRAAIVLLLGCSLCGCNESKPPTAPAVQSSQVHELSGRTMGTTYMVKFPKSSVEDAKLEALSEGINEVLKQVNDEMSTYLEASQISRFNRFEKREPFTVSPPFAAMVQESLRIGEESGGAFDVTVMPLVNLWGFGPEGRKPTAPTSDQIASARAQCGQDQLGVTQGDRPTLWKKNPKLHLDLSAIAKGHGVDRVGAYLNEQGLSAWFVEIGGEIRAQGRKSESAPWVVATEAPKAGAREILLQLELENQAIATSGDYRNFFTEGGKRFSHTIDPRSGRPIEHRLGAVTVVHESCATADAWATALLVLGPPTCWELAEAKGIAASFVLRGEDGMVNRQTGAFKRLRFIR